MNETTWTPEEFERLVSLPADDPERRRAEASLAFQARLRMQEAFTAPPDAPLEQGESERVGAELSVRLERALGIPIPRRGPAEGFPARAVREGAGSSRGPRAALAAWLVSPRLRQAFALAAVLAVAAIGWWMLGDGEAPHAVRGTAPEVAGIALAEPVARSGGVELAWSAMPGAETYRVVFYGDRLEELARLDGLEVPGVLLRAEALPPGLPRGAEVAVEVQALLHGDVIATSRVLSLRVP